MKVTQLQLAGTASWPPLRLDRLHPELNVFYGRGRSGKSTVVRLAGHLLYGKAGWPQRQEFGAVPVLPEGSVDVDSEHGRYVLRRQRDATAHGRLMIAAANGATVDSRTIRGLLYDLPPRLLGELYAVDFAEPPRPERLLSGEFARSFRQMVAPTAVDDATTRRVGIAPLTDRGRIDELIRRRDDIVRQIEDRMSGQLRESAAIEQELDSIETALAERRTKADDLRIRLAAAEAQLAGTDAQLRYFSLEAAARGAAELDPETHRRQLEELDAEIGRVRQMLADLQARQAAVRCELAEVQPDGIADSADIAADQRATVGVIERLLDDLDAEIGQLARGPEPAHRAGPEAHLRLAPVAEMLRQQAYALCGQISEQERSSRRAQRGAEARQLDRTQTDLAEQLEHLLARRQSLVHAADLAARPAVLLPQSPVARHCQCSGHEEFVRRSASMVLGQTDRGRRQEGARQTRQQVERQRDSLREACRQIDGEIEGLTAEWRRLQYARGQGSRASLDALRAELDRLEAEINRELLVPRAAVAEEAHGRGRVWKASDVLAQLTGGRLAQIRLNRDGEGAVIIDRAGSAITVESLTRTQQNQLHVALVLAVASSLAHRGVELPLVLDEPFLRLDAAETAAMCGVLREFARDGRQVFVFTENREAVRRFGSLGVEAADLDEIRRRESTPVVAPAVEPEVDTVVRVVREPVDAPQRAVAITHKKTGSEIYYLSVDSHFDEFPVLGGETSRIFAKAGLQTVADLLCIHPITIAHRLNRPEATVDAVRLWQTHTALLCFVPGLSLVDAQVLAACDIPSPEALFTVDVQLLARTIEQFLATETGRRFAASRKRFTRQRLSDLQKHARLERSRWQIARPSLPWIEQGNEAARSAARTKRALKARVGRTGSRRRPATVKQGKPAPGPLRFRLALNSPAADAPSIDRVTAERLVQVGIRTIADLLNANPRSAAEEIGVPQITAARISQWQAEARLACRIPELRSIAARILVACGITEPEQLAGMAAGDLVSKVKTFCNSRSGRNQLGDAPAPTRRRILEWQRRASAQRPLEAA